jgi:CHC2 zinc finger
MSHGAVSRPSLRLYTPRLMARRDWNEIRERIDLIKVAAALLGPPMERRGLRTGSLGWRCPFDEGATPSFRVNLGEATWSCFHCGSAGDAVALVMRMKGMVFLDAIAWLDEQEGFGLVETAVDDHDQPFPWGKVIPVLRRDLSGNGDLPAMMERGERPERAPEKHQD